MSDKCGKDCGECGGCKKHEEGFEIEIGRDDKTNDFCIIFHDGEKPAPDAQLLDSLKRLVSYLEEELDGMGDNRGNC